MVTGGVRMMGLLYRGAAPSLCAHVDANVLLGVGVMRVGIFGIFFWGFFGGWSVRTGGGRGFWVQGVFLVAHAARVCELRRPVAPGGGYPACHWGAFEV